MVRNLLLAGAVLLVSVATTYAQTTLPFPNPAPGSPPPTGKYWVQFRQPSWKIQQFSTPAGMDAFASQQASNGWEVQVIPSAPGTFAVRYRLARWGGSRVMPTLRGAQLWADSLAAQGFEPRIVPYAK